MAVLFGLFRLYESLGSGPRSCAAVARSSDLVHLDVKKKKKSCKEDMSWDSLID